MRIRNGTKFYLDIAYPSDIRYQYEAYSFILPFLLSQIKNLRATTKFYLPLVPSFHLDEHAQFLSLSLFLSFFLTGSWLTEGEEQHTQETKGGSVEVA